MQSVLTTEPPPLPAPANPRAPKKRGTIIFVNWKRRAQLRPPELVINETCWIHHGVPRTLADALTGLVDDCIVCWNEINKQSHRDHSIRIRRILQQRTQTLAMARHMVGRIFSRRLEPRSIAWAHQVTRNFIKTLDDLTNAVLGVMSQPGFVTRPEGMKFDLDPNIAGYYSDPHQCAELGDISFHASTPYAEDSKGSRDITIENIANIYRASTDWVELQESVAHARLRDILQAKRDEPVPAL